MSWVFMVSVLILGAALVLIEVRAVRAGDERRRHAPGYAFVMGGLIPIGLGMAAALTETGLPALIVSSAGLVAVVLGSMRHREAALR